MDDWEGGAGPEQQQDNEARRFEEDQMRRESEAFDRLMRSLWSAIQTQWRHDRAES